MVEIKKLNGWDFSQVKVKTVGEKWDFYKLVRSYSNPFKSVVLDIGTGGGEKFLAISLFIKKGIGFDVSLEMIKTAKENKIRKNIVNIDFIVADTEKNHPFENEIFDIVSCRQAKFNAQEIYRVIKKGGIFFTQQVDEADKSNIKKVFGRGQGWGRKNENLMNECIRKLKEAGFKKLKAKTYNATEYYKTPEDILFILANTPIIPGFDIDNSNDKEKFEKFITENSSPEGIKTNSYRFLIIAEK